MNFLSHFYIADQTDTDVAGAIAADFVRGSLQPWPEPLQTGMALHRQVDSFVDGHELTLALKAQFAPQHRRMAGILLDMAFDHQLAQHFEQWHPLSLHHFSQHCYQQLLSAPLLPPDLATLAPKIAAGDWLSHYQYRHGINRSITGIAQRLSKPQRLLAAQDEIWRLEAPIATGFTQLMPELLQHCHQWLHQR
ncbi:ACP phosphodiesterase [uncultured Ferrimonas sp.]|uniref:acyl carrier protein phosphodiesterase n=1 Tax=uncultured Ferrimonas sp. TaxID=432640 RepID=UPI00261AC5A5|nr:ACP phosphodiesterase [uncultured Ferrimonas sp.]